MSSSSNELQQFHQFVTEQLAQGGAELSPEECLQAWRTAHPAADALTASVAAVREGLEQARRGEGRQLDEFLREFRSEQDARGDAT